MHNNKLLVVGGASSDILHLKEDTAKCAGGAGMYTAVAATHCGADSTLFGPRPNASPKHLTIVDDYLSDWIGPVVPADQLPEFEISYRNNKTEYLTMSLNSEDNLSSEMLPRDMSNFLHPTALHCTAVL